MNADTLPPPVVSALDAVRRGMGGRAEASTLEHHIVYLRARVATLSKELCDVSVEARRLRGEGDALKEERDAMAAEVARLRENMGTADRALGHYMTDQWLRR